jgi:hypothetical protein
MESFFSNSLSFSYFCRVFSSWIFVNVIVINFMADLYVFSSPLSTFNCSGSYPSRYESMVSKRSSLYLFLYACPQRGQGIRSWDTNYLSLCKIILVNPDNLPWWKKRETIEHEILLNCCSRKPSHDKGMR